MKFKYVLAILLLFALIACVHAKTFTPDEGIFAYQEVKTYDINGIDFTVPTDYKVIHKEKTKMDFKHGKDKLKISVTKGGKIKKVKKNKAKKITSSKTMLGLKKGYLVDRNGAYTFSYKEKGKLVVIKSKDMAFMMGVIGED